MLLLVLTQGAAISRACPALLWLEGDTSQAVNFPKVTNVIGSVLMAVVNRLSACILEEGEGS